MIRNGRTLWVTFAALAAATPVFGHMPYVLPTLFDVAIGSA